MEEMRLDDLAAAAGTPTSTIRLYRQRNLLHPPRLVGRTGWYDESHLARLRLIARLQDDGFSLAGIAKLLESWEQGRDLRLLVGVEQQLSDVLTRPGVELDLPALAARLPPGSLTPEVLERARRVGLVELTEDGRLHVPDARFLDIGPELAQMGVPLEAVLDEWAELVGHTDAVADRFLRLFRTHVLPADVEELDDDQLQALAGVLSRLRHQAGQVLLAAFDASLARASAEQLGRLV